MYHATFNNTSVFIVAVEGNGKNFIKLEIPMNPLNKQ
jgi:hypothetical protein